MEWLEVTIKTISPAIDLLGARLTAIGYDSFIIDDSEDFSEFLKDNTQYWDYVDEELLNKPIGETKVTVYVSENPYGHEIFLNIKAGVERLKSMDIGLDLGRLAIETKSNLDDQEWLNKWKEFYKPFCVGNRIFVKPVWEDMEAPDGRVTFKINPGHVFGTGLHQTTQLCMLQLEKYIDENSVVADLGCGSGILSVVALLLGAKSAFAVDIDANAIKTAYENADLSGVDKSKYYVTSGNVIDDKALQDEIGYDKYDVVVANIIADVICAISPVVPKQLKKGGVFIASGIIKDRIDDVYKALAEVGLKVIDTSIKDEWVSITSIKE